MPDFGLTEALAAALKASKAVEVMRPAEQKLAAQAAKAAPQTGGGRLVLKPVAPEAPPPVAEAPATPAPGATQAPPINLSEPPAEVPATPQTPDVLAQAPENQPAPPEVAASAADAAPPTEAVATSQPVPETPQPAPTEEPARASALPPPATPEPGPTAVQETAQRFVHANLGDFSPETLDMTHMPNVDVMSSPDGVKAAILTVANDNKGAIDAARRGTISDEQLTGLAQDLAANKDIVKQVLDREFGTTIERPEVMLAARMVEQQQMGTLLGLADRVANGTATSAEIIQFQQHSDLLAKYITQMQGAKAESFGRMGRALQIPVGLPADVMDHIAGILTRNNPDQQAVAQAIKLAASPSGIANIISGMAGLPLWRRVGKAGFGLLQRIFINGILSGPQTWLKIFTGNNVNLALNNFDILAAGIGRGIYGYAARLGEFPSAAEGATISDAVAHMHGVISGGADALRVAGRVMRTGQSMDGIMRSQEDFGRNSVNAALPEFADSYFGRIAKHVDTAIDMPGRIIGSIDDFTKTLGYRGYLTMMQLKEVRARLTNGTLAPGAAEQVMQDLMKNASPEMQQAAEEWAHRMTFQSPFPPGGPGEAFQAFLNKAPALRFIFPFMRTATNIFKQSVVERTPFALASARLRNQIAAGGFEADLAKGRIATGTAIAGLAAWMAIHDRVTGPAPKDAKERMEWQLDGRTPNSIRITDPLTGKDTWHDYSWFEPMATIVSATADVVKLQSYLYHDDDTLVPHENHLNDAAAHIVMSVIENTGNKTFMQGASAFSEMYNDPKRAFSMWADQTGASMVPFSGALKFARNEQDPYMRQAFTLIDKIKDELPTFGGIKGSKTLPARLDVFGEPRYTRGGNSILGPLNPLPSSPSKRDEVTEEVQSLMEQTHVVPLTMPAKQIANEGGARGLEGGHGMRLTAEEYNDLTRMSRSDPIFDGGKLTFREKLEQVMASPVYQTATPSNRSELITSIQNQADRIGRERLFKENPDFAERMTAWTAEKNRLKYNR